MVRRKQYETPQDRENQERVARRCEQLFNCKAHNLSKSYRLDYALTRLSPETREHELVAWAEIKARNNSIGHYPTYLISSQKLNAARCFMDTTGSPFFLFVEFTDALAYMLFNTWGELQTCSTWAWGGRSDRNDPDDKEPVGLIDVARFVLVSSA